MEQQEWMDVFASHGEPLFEAIVRDSSDDNSDGETLVEAIADFLKNKFTAVFKPVTKPKGSLTPDPLPLVPPEIYRPGIDKLKRRKLFYKHLLRCDVLYLQVINCDDEENYKCLALAKHGDLLQIDDLSLVFYFPKLPPELKLLGEDLCKFDLIRGAFWSCDHWQRKLFVTLDISVFSEEEREKIPQLGKITRKDLPHYVDGKKVGMTYAGYVERSASFREPDYCINVLQDCLGTDAMCFTSFFEERNKKTYPASESLAELQKRLHPDPSLARLIQSFEYFRTGDMFQALYYANKALMINPDSVQARVTRGTIYANLGKLKKAFRDTEDALKIDPDNETARKQMSELLVSASRIYLCDKEYSRWRDSLLLAKNYNPDNCEAEELLSKTKYETLSDGENIPVIEICPEDETRPEDETNPQPVKVFIPPSPEDVLPIYNRISLRVDKARLIKQYKKQRREKRRRDQRRNTVRRKRTLAVGTVTNSQPIPTTTSRRPIFHKPSPAAFRRPFPPRNNP
ncbi:tetratricopeptide repeat protein 14-like [Argiope bruennichi]|nr:tetratricopeptide repeat protein 14-like [Argiope bruennichi]